MCAQHILLHCAMCSSACASTHQGSKAAKAPLHLGMRVLVKAAFLFQPQAYQIPETLTNPAPYPNPISAGGDAGALRSMKPGAAGGGAPTFGAPQTQAVGDAMALRRKFGAGG